MRNTYKNLHDKTNYSTYLVKLNSAHFPIYYTGELVESESYYSMILDFSDQLIALPKGAKIKFGVTVCNRKPKKFPTTVNCVLRQCPNPND